MPLSRDSWVRKSACPTDLGGGQCIRNDQTLTHLTNRYGEFDNGPRHLLRFDEDEVSMRRGEIPKAEACRLRNGRQLVHPADIARARIRRATAGDLREQGFAVIHTCGRAGEANGHVSVIWPDTNPLSERESDWPAPVQEAFAACFTEVED